MTTARNNKLVGATGEYLVAAELSRRRLIATTFTGNVPHYDIIASDETGRHVSVQVKASRGPSWQFGNISLYCDITFNGKKQLVGEKKPCPVRRLMMVFVRIDEDGNDHFYILPWMRFRDMLVAHHSRTSRSTRASARRSGTPFIPPYWRRISNHSETSGRP